MYRQGDILLIPVPRPDAPPAKHIEAERVVIAQGEATGHDHVLFGQALHYEPNTQFGRLVHLIEGGTLRHIDPTGRQADHAPIKLPAGWYRIGTQREYVEPTRFAPARTRRVRD